MKVEHLAKKESRDTIVVPAHDGGFKKVFWWQDCCYEIWIFGGMLPMRCPLSGSELMSLAGNDRPQARTTCFPESRRSRRSGVMTGFAHESSRNTNPSLPMLHARTGASEGN
jgi:hypothetical protein